MTRNLRTSLILIMTPVARNLRTGTRNLASVLRLAPRVVLVILIAWLWVGLVVDQMPCFLGVPNCD